MERVDFEALFEQLPDAYLVVDRDCRCVSCNRAYLQVAGRERADVIGQPLQAVVDFPYEVLASVEQVLATRRPNTLELVPDRDPLHERSPLYWTNTPMFDDQGEVELVVQRSIYGRLLPQLEVRQVANRIANDYGPLEAHLNHLRESIDEAAGYVVLTRGPSHLVETVNRAVGDIPGKQHVVGKSFEKGFPLLALQGMTVLLDNVYRTGKAYVGRGIRCGVPKEGGRFEATLDIVCQPIIADSTVAGIYLQGFEVSGTSRSTRSLLELLPAFVYVAEPSGGLAFINNQTLEYFNATREQVVGDGWVSFVAPEDRAGLLETWAHSIATGMPFEREYRLRRADGSYRWYLSRAIAHRDERGEILEWIGANIDIDDTRRVREELHERSDYEQRLIGIVSHDLRNPLNAIALAASLLLEQPGIDRALVEKIVSSSDRASRLVRDLLDLAHVRSHGAMPLAPATTNLHDVVREVVQEIQPMHPDHEITLELVDGETAHCDADRIAQLVGNLLVNALQHSSATSAVRVRVCERDRRVEIEVHNDGSWIEPDEVARLFEPFWRGRAARVQGFGLGLSIAHAIAVGHRGALDVRSSQADGTSFILRLPRH